jgi:hypothetical protein
MTASQLLLGALLAWQEPAAPIEWGHDLVAAQAEAARRKVPLLAVFRCER